MSVNPILRQVAPDGLISTERPGAIQCIATGCTAMVEPVKIRDIWASARVCAGCAEAPALHEAPASLMGGLRSAVHAKRWVEARNIMAAMPERQGVEAAGYLRGHCDRALKALTGLIDDTDKILMASLTEGGGR